jgi:phosphoribosylformylglycinamidine cyclo-ligase
MPGFYADGEYDVAGFIVGAVGRDRLIDGRSIAAGDVLIGLPSSGLHTNGYSLARRIVFDLGRLDHSTRIPELGASVGEALMVPHRSYLKVVRPLLPTGLIKGMAHITGGGITDNLPRVLPDGLHAEVDLQTWEVPPLFRWLQAQGAVPDDDMRRTFNLGIGLIVVCAAEHADDVGRALAAAGEAGARRIGRIAGGGQGVRYIGV